MKKKVEILAPAGSYESMKAAVAAGADAVYIGGSRFGARMRIIRERMRFWRRLIMRICTAAGCI